MSKSFIFALHAIALAVVATAYTYHGADLYWTIGLTVGLVFSAFRKCL